MPEGPEIRLEADKIAAAISGEIVDEVYFEQKKLKCYERQLRGSRVESVSARGKALLISFENSLTMYSHNQLYGRWYVRPRGEKPNTNRTLRAALHGPKMSALLYSASEIAVLAPEQLAKQAYLQKLGPDPLDGAVSWKDFVKRLRSATFAKRSLGALYLDQSFIAGIGNYLRSEILFRAGLLPDRILRDLSLSEIHRLARATVTITRRAYEKRGVTNPAQRVSELKKRGLKRGSYRFAVFARAGKPCYECGKRIERIEFSGRRLYLCRRCQA